MFGLKKKRLIYFTVSILLLLVLSGLVTFLKAPLLNTLKYPLNLLALIKREIGGIIFYHRNLIQNEKFKKDIELLKHNLNVANEIYLENKRLKSLLSFKQDSPYKIVAGRVIGRAPDNWSSSIIIDKGRYQGIKRGMVAITPLGLVGRVIATTESTAKILLINDPNLSVSCIVKRSRQEGLISGALGGTLMMKYLPKDSDIQISDVVITSGLTDTYPKGLLVGTVTEVADELLGLARYAIIKPAVNLSNIEEVLIIIP